MCACSFDMHFTFVNVGWEGSANDCRVFESARNNPSFNFPHPPPGKYYVVDSGYANQTGYLTPFRGERYHLPDYRGAGRTPRTVRELFNYRHSSLRNVIERTFGVLKNKILLLRQTHHFSVKTQGNIVIACCGLHNYIRDEQKIDKDFSKLGGDEAEPDPDELNPPPKEYNGPSSLSQREQARQMNDIRNRLTNVLARKHCLAPI
ncbi:putative nuclease HARBI1 [Telopea speciosissima]|uniref:putative nuclease HARBI1 n=1 Tax=Telopea speciosissima TaxID=54955 RepID=UPI001CC55289|nr:putative nuclease HARBI1 [Telopea speciosissima]